MLLIGFAGACLTWRTVRLTDLKMRDELLGQSRIVAETFELNQIQALAGSEVDLSNPVYQRLKEQLIQVRTTIPLCRFVYLLGRNDEGKLFFFVDSESSDSKDYSPPGQIYEEATETQHHAYNSRSEAVAGPYKDRWGTWVSGMVPIMDSKTALWDQARPDDAKAVVETAVDFYRKNGRDSDKGDGQIVAMLGMDVDARAWNRMLFLSALPVLWMVGALGLIVLIGALILGRRSRLGAKSPRWMDRIESALAGGVGLVLSLLAAWMLYWYEIDHCNDTFNRLALNRTRTISEILRDKSQGELEGLAHFYEHSSVITDAEFQKFISYLVVNQLVQAWLWAPVVPADQKKSFEQTAREERTNHYEIWEKDANGKAIPANGRAVYYPILQAAPLKGTESVIGFDLGSESKSGTAIHEALRTGLPTGTDPITLIQRTGRQKGELVYYPIFEGDDSRVLRGFVVMVLRMGDFLRDTSAEHSVALELSILKKGAPPESLAVSWTGDNPPDRMFELSRPIFAFGKIYNVTAYPGVSFMKLYHPLVGGCVAFVVGLLLTSGLVVVISMLIRRKEVLERLVSDRTAELHLQAGALNAAANSIVITNKSGVILWVNPAFSRFTGYSAEEAIGRTPSVLKSGQHDAGFYKHLWATVLRGQVWRGEMINRRKDGELTTEYMTITPIKSKDGAITHFVAVKQDITDQKRVEAELRQAEIELRHMQKMESIGNLAAGIAHEINTPLQFVLNNIQFLGDAFSSLTQLQGRYQLLMERFRNGTMESDWVEAVQAAEKDASLEYLNAEIPVAVEQSKDGVGRVKKIVHAMKEFSHPGEDKPSLIDLNQAILSTITVGRSEWKKVAEMVTILEPDLPLVSCFSSEINQVVLNLVVNASHAIGDRLERGKAGRVAEANAETDAESFKGVITVTTHRDGDWVKVQVADNGCGVPEAVEARIFDPFFTTKGVGKGSGLGLSIAHGIIEKKHRGRIGFVSRRGEGTTFFFQLPLNPIEAGIEKQKQFY